MLKCREQQGGVKIRFGHFPNRFNDYKIFILLHVVGYTRFKLYGFPNDIELPFRVALKSRVLYSIYKYMVCQKHAKGNKEKRGDSRSSKYNVETISLSICTLYLTF